MMIVLRLAALAALLATAGALSFGYLGWLHPAFDSFAHFRIHLAVVLLVGVPVLMLLRFWPEALFAVALGMLSIIQTTGLPFTSPLPRASAAGEGSAVYRLFHANLRFDNARPEAILSLIGENRPDVVTLNEVSQMWIGRLEALSASYPYSVICPSTGEIGGVAILSRRPFVHGIVPFCGDRGSYAHAAVDFGGRMIDVATVHLGWPWPYGQRWQVEHHVMPLLRQVGPSALLAGDLNAAPWSDTARLVASGLGAQTVRGIGPTWLSASLPDWLRPLVGLPIDNVMTKGTVIPISVRTLTGGSSDHLPVLLEFTIAPQPQTANLHLAAN